MAFRFDTARTVPENAEDMLVRQISKAIRLLSAGLEHDAVVAPGIHGARKNFKKARALLKLIRPGLKRGPARRMAAALRDCGRGLAAERDRTVGLETLTWLAAQPDGLPLRVSGAVRKLYLAPSDPTVQPSRDLDAGTREALIDVVQRAEAALDVQMAALQLERLDEAHVASAYAASYAKGRERFFALDILSADDEDVHDLRKPLQEHWRQTALLLDLWPDYMSLRLETARRVSKALGVDHDLSILAERVAEGLHVPRLADEKRILLDRCHGVQRQLRREARPWLERLYAPPPASWEETIVHMWRAARDEFAQDANEGSQSLIDRVMS